MAMEQTSGPHRRWGGAKAPYERFCKAKTSAQAEFTSAEHDEKLGSHKISFCGRLLHGHHHRGAGVKKYIDRSTLRGAPVFCKVWSPWERFCPTHFFCLAKTESRPRFPGQVSPDGDLLFARAKSRQKHAGGRPRMDCKRQGRALVLSALSPGPPRPRKVRSTSFSPNGKNFVRSLARPLPTRPASLGSCGGPNYGGPG